MTTDYGIDLVAYDPEARHSFSIQVKTSAMGRAERRPDWKVKEGKSKAADLFAFVLKNQQGEVWYLSQTELKKYTRLYNHQLALTFYRTDAPPNRLTETDMARFKDLGGLESFVRDWRKSMKASAAKITSGRS